MPARLHIVGLGIGVPPLLGEPALSALSSSQTIIGSLRQLDLVRDTVETMPGTCELVELPKLAELKALITTAMGQDQNVSVLASGDPLFYGIGRWLGQQFSANELCFHPGISSLQMACHRLGLSLQDTETVSLHGRPLSNLRSRLGGGKTIIALTDAQSQPQHIAQVCLEAGFGESQITLCEDMGYDDERVRHFSVSDLLTSAIEVSPLHVTVIKVQGGGGCLPEFPGIADELFSTGAEPGKGMISKREVRLSILSLMQVQHGDVVWDLGAGCGSVAIELARWAPAAHVHAVEHHEERLQYLAVNRERFGVVSNLQIHAATAPDCFAQLPAPTKIFIGGSDGRLMNMLEEAWALLPNGGRLVASAVVDKTRAILNAFVAQVAAESTVSGRAVDIESVELSVKRNQYVNGEPNTLQRLPVEIFKFEKQGS